MIYVKSIFGGFAALLLSYVISIIWLSKLAPKHGTIGVTGVLLFSPRVLFVEIAIFIAGFLIVWLLMRQK
ncbi:hypothetical protein HDF10_000416 [Edaphobacter lichenicola]|uniref:Uncharacterized protein n=1 Tax=Tunturiibacter lichenicola TaxID=2051959 RepID=A0A7W8N3G0_9BACT|nr:hypothetical protein [Edaphobacter lichenicola]